MMPDKQSHPASGGPRAPSSGGLHRPSWEQSDGEHGEVRPRPVYSYLPWSHGWEGIHPAVPAAHVQAGRAVVAQHDKFLSLFSATSRPHCLSSDWLLGYNQEGVLRHWEHAPGHHEPHLQRLHAGPTHQECCVLINNRCFGHRNRWGPAPASSRPPTAPSLLQEVERHYSAFDQELLAEAERSSTSSTPSRDAESSCILTTNPWFPSCPGPTPRQPGPRELNATYCSSVSSPPTSDTWPGKPTR